MILLDLSEAKRANPRAGKRVMNPQNSPALLGGTVGGFQSAKIDRLTGDWSTVRRSMDQELRNGLTRLRARARERALNSPIGSKFQQMLRTNIIGAHGIKVEFKIEKQRKHDTTEIYDDDSSAALTKAFKTWCRKEYCTVQGNLSFQDVLNLWCDAIGRDGDFLLRLVILPKSQNPFGFALQLIDADQLNEAVSRVGGPQSPSVRMGVELDPYQKPLAYWLYDGNPNEVGFGSANCHKVPADQVIHSFIPRRVGQSRGYPLLAPVLWDMNMLDKYFDAELTAARIGSTLLASIEQKDASGEYAGDGENLDGSAKLKLENGTLPIMPQGYTLNNQTPEHPTAAFNPFVERSLRIIASGLGVPYHELGNDLASVNFSSGRLGRQEAIDYWMELQRKVIQDVVEPVVARVIRYGLLNSAINLPYAPDRYLDPDALHYIPRRWDYVDPLKDVQADIDSIQNGLDTHESALARRGKDYRDVFQQLKREQDLADELGLVIGTDIRGEATSEENDGPPAAGAATEPAEPATKPKPKPKKGKKAAAQAARRERQAVLLAEKE